MFDQDTEAPEQPEAGTVNEAETEAQEWAQLEGMAAGVTTGTAVTPAGELAEPDISTAEMLYPLLSAGFSILAPNWQVTDDEVQALSSSYGQAMDAVFPEINIDPRVAAVLGAVTTTGLIIGPRWHTPRIEKEVNKAPPKSKAKPAEPAQPEKPAEPVNIKLD